MNGQFPPWDGQAGYSRGVTHGSHTRVDNNDEVPAQHGKVTTDGNYEERSGDLSNTIWPDASQHKEDRGLDKNSSNWTSLEMSNGVELEQDASCRTSAVYSKQQSPTTRLEPEKVHVDPVVCTFSNAFEKCRTDELISARNSSVILFAGSKTTSVKSSQDLQQREVNFLMDDSSVNDKVQKETTCRTLEQCSSLGFYKTTEICCLGQHVPTKEKQVSDVMMQSCLSDKLSTPSGIIGNREGTLLLAASKLRQISKEHTKSYKDNSPSRYVDSHVRTQTPNFESHVPDNSSQTTQHECAGSEMKLICTTTENQKPVVSHNGLVVMEENVKEKSNTIRRSAFNSALAEPSSACSSNSVGQLENVVQNLYKKMLPTSALKPTQPFQFQTDATTETAAECEDSNLRLGPGGSLDMAANAECTQTKEAAPTVPSPQKDVSSQAQCCGMDAQEPFAFQDSAAEPENLGSGDAPFMKATGKVCLDSPNKKTCPQLDSLKNGQQSKSSFTSENIPQKPKSALKRQETPRKRRALDCEALTGQAQKRTCESRVTSDYSPLSNLEGSSLNMEGLTEGLKATDVLQCERKKKPEETSQQPEEQLLDTCSVIKTPTSNQECEAIALIAKEGKNAEQSGIKRHIRLENAAPVSDQIEAPREVLIACTASASVLKDNGTTNSNCESTKRTKGAECCASQDNLLSLAVTSVNETGVPNVHSSQNGKTPTPMVSQTVFQKEECLSSVSTSAAQKPVKAKALEGKNTNKTIKHVTSTDILSSSHGLFEDLSTTLDVQKPTSNQHIRKCSEKEVNSVHAAYKAEAQNSLHEPVQFSLEGFSIVKPSEEPTFEQNTKAAKEKVETYKEPDANLDLDIAFQPVSDIKTEPGEDRDYLKKLRQRESTSRKHFLDCEQTTNNVNPEPDIYPQSCSELPGAHFENVSDVLEKGTVSSKAEEPQEDYSSNHAELDLKTDNLKSSKAHAVKKKRAGRSFQKRKLMRLAKPSRAMLKTSRNITVKGLQKISQNDVSRDFKTEVKSEKAQTESSVDSARKPSCIRQNDASSNVQTRSSMRLVLSDTCESPEQKQSVLSHSVATVDPGDSQTRFSDCSVSGRGGQKSPRRPPKKLRKSTQPKTNPMQAALIYEAEEMDSMKVSKQSKSVAAMENDVPLLQISCVSTSATSAENEIRATEPTNLIKQRVSRTCRESTLLKIAIATGLDYHTSGQRTSSKMVNRLQALPAHAKKKGKKSKLQLSNMNILSVRHSRRWSRFSRGKIRCLQEPDHNAEDDSFSSQEGHRKSTIRKKRKHKKKKSALKKSNTTNPLPKSRCDDTDECQLTSTFVGKDQKTCEDSSLGPRTLFGHHSRASKGKVLVVATWIPPRAGELNNQCVVADTKLLENSSDTLGGHAGLQEDICGQKRHTLKKPPSVAECRDNPGVEAELKNNSKMSKENPEWVSKRKALSQQANSLPQESSKILLDCFKSPLKTGVANEVHTLGDAEICSTKVFYADNNTVLLNATVDDVHYALSTPESTDKDLKIEKCSKKGRQDEEKKDTPSTETNGGDAYELSLQSSVNTSGFCSTETWDTFCHKKIKEGRSEKLVMDASIGASDLELKVASEGISLGNSGSRYVSGFAQYFEDFISTLNKGSCVVNDAVLPKALANKCIICKYCGQSFRNISAYTIHRRIHTGEKPYRCRLCGKNFAQLSKLKSHRKIHTQPEALHCPCCSRKFFRKGSLVSHFKIHLQETTQSNGPNRDIKRSSSSAGPLKSFLSDQRLLCKICDKTFPDKSMLRIHMHMHERKSDLSCATCGKKFQNSSHLQVHKKTHWPVKPYACCICGKGFNRLKALKNHSLGHTGETPFSCSHCGHAFHDLSALRGHQVSKLCRVKGKINGGNCDIEGFLVSQGFEGQINTPVFFKCRICKQLCRKWCQYTLHLETHTKSPPYLCFSCGQSYVKDSDVSIHCKVCCQFSGEEAACRASLSEIFPRDSQKYTSSPSASTLNPSKTKTSSISNGSYSQKDSQDSQTPTHRLQRTEHLNPNSCEVMETSPLPETDTADLHSGPPSPTPSVVTCVSSNDSLDCVEITPTVCKFQCPRCGQRYERYRTLRAHMQTHAHGFRYVCGPCGQSFERWNRLWLHQRIHRKKHRCYSCSQCNLQFRFSGSYKVHMLSHAGKRPFACPVCPETFTCEEALQAHRREYHQSSKILQCDVCAKTFSNLGKLLKHSRLHNGAVSHQCLACNLSFTNNKILQEHWKTHHNTLSLPLPGLPSEPLAFSHTCKRCKASFSTGDLLYAHQICHFGVQFGPTHTNKSTSPVFERTSHPHTESTSPSTTRPLINLDAVPDDERVYAYPHPDRHYVLPCLSRTRVPIIILDSEGEEDTQPASGDRAFASIDLSGSERLGERMSESIQFSSETNTTRLPQASESPESTPVESQPTECLPAPCTIPSDVSDQGSPNSVTQTDNFVETCIFLEEPNTQRNQESEESFECADCSYNASSLQGLHEHYFLHAFGN